MILYDTMMLIRKVWLKKSTNQNMVTIAKESNIKTGDYVRIIKVEDEDGETQEE